jgi:phosphatidylglycerophosphatase A
VRTAYDDAAQVEWKTNFLGCKLRTNPRLMSKSQSDNFLLRDVFRESGVIGKTALAFSTWFGTGLLPVAPGTFGSLAAIPLGIGMAYLGVGQRVLVFALVVTVAIWASGRSQKLLARHDPSVVVIDEVAGYLLTVFLLPPAWLNLVMGLIFFRFFDIVKPYPVKRLESLKGGIGIVMDDLAAGIYAFLVTKLILSFIE